MRTRWIAPALVGVAAALAVGPPVGAETGGAIREVAMPGKAYVPHELDVLLGDTVVWKNQDMGSHTVTAGDDSFDSGYIPAGGSYARTFTRPATIPYACTIHRFMRGVLRVVPVALTGPHEPVPAGGAVSLSGLAPSGTGEIRLEQATGPRWAAVRTIRAGVGGTFSARLRVTAPARFRARVGGAASATVHVAAAPRVRARLASGTIVARVSPRRIGAVAVLQRYDRERFAWRTIGRSVVGAGSRVRIALPPNASGHYRLLVRGHDGWADGASRAIPVG